MAQQEFADLLQRDIQGFLPGESVRPGSNQGKSDALCRKLSGQAQRCCVAGAQDIPLTPGTVHPDRADGMNNILRGEPEGRGHRRAARLNLADLPPGRQQLRLPGGMIDCAVGASADDRRRVGGVDNNIRADLRNVIPDNLKRHLFTP